MIPIPSDSLSHPSLKTFCQDPPWRVNSILFGRSPAFSDPTYYKVTVLPSDPEYYFVLKYFSHQQPTNRAIKCIYFIHNSRLSQRFEQNVSSMEKETKNSHFQPKWRDEEPKSLRQNVFERFEKLVSPYTPFTIPWDKEPETCNAVKVLPLWHGSRLNKCQSICQTGFQVFGKHALVGKGGSSQNTDAGYFGSGIYFTTSARYAADAYSDKENLLLAWVAVREPYPVVNDTPLSPQGYPQSCGDMKRLGTLGAYENYNAHYIPVASANPSDADCKIYYPSPKPVLDEIVVFHPPQALCTFWIEMQVDLAKMVPKSPSNVGQLLDLLIKLADHGMVKKNYPFLSEAFTNKVNILSYFPETDPLEAEDQNFYELAQGLILAETEINNAIVELIMKNIFPGFSFPVKPPISLSPAAPIAKVSTAAASPQTENKKPSEEKKHPLSISPSYSPMIDVAEISTFKRPGGFPTCSLLQLPNGILATGSTDSKIQLWNILLRTYRNLEGHLGYVHALTSLLNGIWASGGDDKTIKIWDLSTNTCLRTLEGHSSCVRALLGLLDGTLVSGSFDKTIKIWDPSTGTCLHTLEARSGVNALVDLRDGTIASGCEDGTIKIWDLQEKRYVRTLKGHTRRVVSFARFPDGTLASGSCNGEILLWNPSTGECKQTLLLLGDSDVLPLAAFTDRILAGGSRSSNAIKLWDIFTGKCQDILQTGEGVIALTQLSDNTLASGSTTGIIKLWK